MSGVEGWEGTQPVCERLVEVVAEDGVVLPGWAIGPGGDAGCCLVWLHGFGMSYDFGPYVEIGRQLAGQDVSFISAAVRGHHGAVTAWRRAPDRLRTVRVGSWYEIFEESLFDIEAWLGYARAAGHSRVVLAGHSFGAVKALYYLGIRGGAVDGLVLASPSLGLTRLEAATATLANEMVAAGMGQELLPPDSWPGGFGTRTVSAQTYQSWSRAAEYLFSATASWPTAIRCPVLAWYGDAGEVGSTAELDLFTSRMSLAASVERLLIPGVTHNYVGGETRVVQALVPWLDRQGLRRPSLRGT